MIEIVATEAMHTHGTAIVERGGAVWCTFSRPWWDVASWVWWWLSPGRKSWILLTCKTGPRVRVRATRIAKQHVKIGGGK